MQRALAALAFLLLAGAAHAQPRRPDAGRLGWYSDYARATAAAKRTGKPILLVFRCEP